MPKLFICISRFIHPFSVLYPTQGCGLRLTGWCKLAFGHHWTLGIYLELHKGKLNGPLRLIVTLSEIVIYKHCCKECFLSARTNRPALLWPVSTQQQAVSACRTAAVFHTTLKTAVQFLKYTNLFWHENHGKSMRSSFFLILMFDVNFLPGALDLLFS